MKLARIGRKMKETFVFKDSIGWIFLLPNGAWNVINTKQWQLLHNFCIRSSACSLFHLQLGCVDALKIWVLMVFRREIDDVNTLSWFSILCLNLQRRFSSFLRHTSIINGIKKEISILFSSDIKKERVI